MVTSEHFTKYGFKLFEKKDCLDIFHFQNLNQNGTIIILTLFMDCDLTCEIVCEEAGYKITPFKSLLVLKESDLDFLIMHCGDITNVLGLESPTV